MSNLRSALRRLKPRFATSKTTHPGDGLAEISAALKAQSELLKKQQASLASLVKIERENLRNIEATRIASTAGTLRKVQEFVRDHQYGYLETLNELKSTGKSFTRFGDGELRLMLNQDFSLRFQKNSPKLQIRLQEILANQDDRVLVGFPAIFRDAHWAGVWAELWEPVHAYLSQDTTYGNAHVSRPSAFDVYGQELVIGWRSLWENERLCVIAGEGSRFELIPELFDSAKSIDRIDSTATGAFQDLERVKDLARKSNFDVFVIALGPAGTVLAAELAAEGRRALDVGHLTASYLNVFENAPRPESIPIRKK